MLLGSSSQRQSDSSERHEIEDKKSRATVRLESGGEDRQIQERGMVMDGANVRHLVKVETLVRLAGRLCSAMLHPPTILMVTLASPHSLLVSGFPYLASAPPLKGAGLGGSGSRWDEGPGSSWNAGYACPGVSWGAHLRWECFVCSLRLKIVSELRYEGNWECGVAGIHMRSVGNRTFLVSRYCARRQAIPQTV